MLTKQNINQLREWASLGCGLGELNCEHLFSHISELESELAAAKGQVERMREALDKIGYLREHDGREDSSYLGRMAREALAKLKEEAIPTSEGSNSGSNSGSSTPKIRELEDLPATSKGEKKCELDHSVISSGDYCLSCGKVILRKRGEAIIFGGFYE